MNTITLETFVAIVETGSLVRASERLHVTQSTVTTRLNTLEQDLGQTLIHRQKSGAVMTLAGLKFKRYAEAMLDLWQKAQSEATLPGSVNQICNIGCIPIYGPFGENKFLTRSAIHCHKPHWQHGQDKCVI